MAQTYPGVALAPSPYFFAYPAPPSATLLPSSSSSSSSSSLPSAGLFRFEKPGHSASLSHGASTTSPSHYGQSHSPSVVASTLTRPRGRTFLVQHQPGSPSSAKRRSHIPPQPLRLTQTNKNNNNNNNHIQQFSPLLSHASGPASSTRSYTFPSTSLSIAPVPSSSSSHPSASDTSATTPSSSQRHHSAAASAAARRRSSAAAGGTFYRQQQHPRSAASSASFHTRTPFYYTHSGNRDYAVMQLVHYPQTPIWSYGRQDNMQHPHHDGSGLSQSQIGKRKRAPSSYALTEDPREALDDDSDRSRLRKSQRPSAALSEEVSLEAELTVHVKEEVLEEGPEQMLAVVSPVVLQDQAASSSHDTANSNAVSSATSLAVHSIPSQYLPGRPHSSAELRPATPEEARGRSTLMSRRPVSAPMHSNPSSSEIVASGLPASAAIPSPPSTKALEALSAVSHARKEPITLRKSVEEASREPAQGTRPGSNSVFRGSALATSINQAPSSALAYRRGQVAQDKARNLSIATSAAQTTAQAPTNLRTAPANPSYHQPQPSPTIAKSFSQARANAGPNTPRRASFAGPPLHHNYHHFSKSTATPLLPHQHQASAHQPQYIEGRPGPAFIPPSAGYITHHRPTHHIPPLPLSHLQGPGLATPATGPILGGPIPHSIARPTKAVFMQDMEALYDSLPDARAIQAHIDHMLDNAAANIGREIEDARNKRVEWEDTMMKRTELFEQNITAELQLLEKKIARLEGGKVANSASPAATSETNAASQTQSTIQVLLRRVEELESANRARNSTSSPRMNHRNSISRLPAISSEDHPTTRPMSSLRDT